MSNEPSQKVILYFLELLIHTKKTFTVSQLTGHFGNGFFTAEMRAAAGVNEKGLREFLLRHPSLFTVQGNNISLYSEYDDPGRQPEAGPNQSTIPEVLLELEAVKYLAQKLAKHQGNNWFTIQHLTCHFSQMAAEIRRVIGRQAELKKFLMRHEHVFEVSLNYVRLREGLETVISLESESFKLISPVAFKDPACCSLYSISKTDMEEIPKTNGLSLQETNPHSHSDPGKHHSEMNPDEDAFIVAPKYSTSAANGNYLNRSALRPSSTDQCNAIVTMTLTEYSAVIFLKNYLEEQGSMKVCGLMEYMEQRATEAIRNVTASSKLDFENFLKKYPQIFSISFEEIVGLVKNAKICVIVTSCAEHSRNKEEFRKSQTLLERDPKPIRCLDKPKLRPVRQIYQDKENTMHPFEDCFQKPKGTLRDVKNLTFDSLLHRSHKRDLPISQKSCAVQTVEIVETVEDRTKTYVSVGCQTLATGDIIATQFYRVN